MSNHSKMKGYISILLLISAALTFDGTEAGCRNRCRNICEQPEKTSGQNCCRGNSGTYLDGSYDYACKNGRCYLGRYMPSSKKVWKIPHLEGGAFSTLKKNNNISFLSHFEPF